MRYPESTDQGVSDVMEDVKTFFSAEDKFARHSGIELLEVLWDAFRVVAGAAEVFLQGVDFAKCSRV